MSVEVSCACGQRFAAERYLIGKRVQCPFCGGPIDVLEGRRPGDAHFANAPPPPGNHAGQGGYPPQGNHPPQRGHSPKTPANVPSVPQRGRAKQIPWGVFSSQTYASNPGRIAANPILYLKHHPVLPLICCVMMLGSVPLALLVDPIFVCGTLTGLFVNLRLLYLVRQKFWNGCVNPGVVVSLDPQLIAVSTDLTRGNASYLAVKIIGANLDSIAGQTPQIGMRVATVALYDEHELDVGQANWGNFDPDPVEYGTDDRAELRRVMASIAPGDWQELNNCLRQVPQPFRPGLYRIGRH